MGERVPLSERGSVVFVAVAAASAALASIGLPKIGEWLTTREQTSVSVQPPTGRVERYSALVTGTATSDFDIAGSKECGGVGSMEVENSWHAVATIANNIGDFTVTASADLAHVTITLDQFPQLESGLQMERSQTNSQEAGVLATCDGGDLIDVTVATMFTAQAAADTIGDCIVARPDFQDGLRNQLQAFGQAAYPESEVVVAPFPQASGELSSSVSALDTLRANYSGRGINITASPIDECQFAEFTMTPIVFTPGGVNG